MISEQFGSKLLQVLEFFLCPVVSSWDVDQAACKMKHWAQTQFAMADKWAQQASQRWLMRGSVHSRRKSEFFIHLYITSDTSAHGKNKLSRSFPKIFVPFVTNMLNCVKHRSKKNNSKEMIKIPLCASLAYFSSEC